MGLIFLYGLKRKIIDCSYQELTLADFYTVLYLFTRFAWENFHLKANFLNLEFLNQANQHSCGSTKLPNQSLRLISQGVHEL